MLTPPALKEMSGSLDGRPKHTPKASWQLRSLMQGVCDVGETHARSTHKVQGSVALVNVGPLWALLSSRATLISSLVIQWGPELAMGLTDWGVGSRGSMREAACGSDPAQEALR
jgi:hypothetical protein